jgi:hypothetical protein
LATGFDDDIVIEELGSCTTLGFALDCADIQRDGCGLWWRYLFKIFINL